VISLNQREIPNYWQGRCFGCSRTNTLGLQLRFWLSEHGCFTRCTIPDYLCGWDGLVHGGIISALLDEVAAWTIIARLARLGITREVSIRYVKPVPTDTELVVEGQIISQDGRNAVLRSTIHSTDGTLLAESESSWMFPRLSSIAKITQIEESTLQQFLARYP
jgi:uncharacterized protein (TIGR00369 family)